MHEANSGLLELRALAREHERRSATTPAIEALDDPARAVAVALAAPFVMRPEPAGRSLLGPAIFLAILTTLCAVALVLVLTMRERPVVRVASLDPVVEEHSRTRSAPSGEVRPGAAGPSRTVDAGVTSLDGTESARPRRTTRARRSQVRPAELPSPRPTPTPDPSPRPEVIPSVVPDAPAPATSEDTACTQVDCILGNHERACCAAFQPTTKAPTAPTPADLRDNLDRDQLTAGIATIRADRCGGRTSERGLVRVSVKVSPEGGVTAVTIKDSPDPALSTCVATEVQKARFARTSRGGSFRYVWRF